MELCHPATVRALMEEAGIHFRKEYGQNFLIEPAVPRQIAQACADEADSLILEIGPGIGCLTRELAVRYAKVVAIEIDRGLIPVLGKTLAPYKNVTVLEGDVMKTDLVELTARFGENRSVSVCANLPYYITTPILMYLLESGVPFSTITVMVQNEVAARLCAAPGSPDYGAITAVLGYYGTVRRLMRVPSGCFMPAPKVDSAVIRLDLFREKPVRAQNEPFFFSVIRAAFGMRRKTLVNALSASLSLSKEKITEALACIGKRPDVRGERLCTSDFVALSDILCVPVHNDG